MSGGVCVYESVSVCVIVYAWTGSWPQVGAEAYWRNQTTREADFWLKLREFICVIVCEENKKLFRNSKSSWWKQSNRQTGPGL